MVAIHIITLAVMCVLSRRAVGLDLGHEKSTTGTETRPYLTDKQLAIQRYF